MIVETMWSRVLSLVAVGGALLAGPVGAAAAARPDLITVEFDQGNARPATTTLRGVIGTMMAQVAADHTSLQVEHTDIWNSDYMPFEAKGYPASALRRCRRRPVLPSAEDTPDKVDLARLAEVTRLVVATVAADDHAPGPGGRLVHLSSGARERTCRVGRRGGDMAIEVGAVLTAATAALTARRRCLSALAGKVWSVDHLGATPRRSLRRRSGRHRHASLRNTRLAWKEEPPWRR